MSSCPNHENVLVEPDMNITDLDEAMLMEYKVLFIPSGKHHRSLPFNKDVQNVLNLCKENQLIISSVCAGNIVLTEIADLVNGYSIASSSITYDAIKEAGGIVVYKDVVEDGVFITGGKGGGKTGNGFEDAPIEALALKIREAVDAK
jgi:putative intracellular protease/amidase